MVSELRRIVEAIALENALAHNGRPSLDAVVKKLLGFKPEYREGIKSILPVIKEVVESVSRLSLEEQLGRYESVKGLIPPHERAVEREGLPPLPGAVEGRVVTRFAPNPDFVLHLGSLRPLILSYEYAKMYKGRFILRFEDTDPRTKRPKPLYYEMILKDLEWLGAPPDEVYYQSERLEIYYGVARELIEKGNAYVCLCSREHFSELVKRGEACPHRDQSVEVNRDLFEKMVSGVFREGEAVLRVKTDLSHPNPSIREWPALRIIDTRLYPHPRVGSKYFVWPLYNFSCPIDDHFLGVTHVFRGEEHRVNEEKQRYVFIYMGWSPPLAIHHGKLAIPEGILSKSKILKGISEGLYEGFDDLRLATVAALRRRGFHPRALRNLILRIGMKSGTSVVDWTMLAAENRKVIDPVSNRYFGVRRPFEVLVKLDSDMDIEIRRHPDYPEKGFRKLVIRRVDGYASLFIDFEDRERFRPGVELRLLHLGNFAVDGDGPLRLSFIDNDVKRAVKMKYPFIHWVSKDSALEALFYYPGERLRGYVERDISNEGVGSHIQLERLGYFKLDSLDSGNVVKVVYTHD
jgi:glutamyl-tRNA synthetase